MLGKIPHFLVGGYLAYHIHILRCLESAWEWVGFVGMDTYDTVWDHFSTSHPFNRSSLCIYDEKITHFHRRNLSEILGGDLEIGPEVQVRASDLSQ